MKIEILEATEGDKEVLRNLPQLYVYDLSGYEGFDVDAHGKFWYRWLDHYWTEEGRQPYLLKVDGRWAGFALVDRHTETSDADRSIAEFFVMRKYRGRGIGANMARHIFQLFPGRWEVRQTASNSDAQAFWRTVIAATTGSRYEELEGTDDRKGPMQVFEVR